MISANFPRGNVFLGGKQQILKFLRAPPPHMKSVSMPLNADKLCSHHAAGSHQE